MPAALSRASRPGRSARCIHRGRSGTALHSANPHRSRLRRRVAAAVGGDRHRGVPAGRAADARKRWGYGAAVAASGVPRAACVMQRAGGGMPRSIRDVRARRDDVPKRGALSGRGGGSPRGEPPVAGTRRLSLVGGGSNFRSDCQKVPKRASACTRWIRARGAACGTGLSPAGGGSAEGNPPEAGGFRLQAADPVQETISGRSQSGLPPAAGGPCSKSFQEGRKADFCLQARDRRKETRLWLAASACGRRIRKRRAARKERRPRPEQLGVPSRVTDPKSPRFALRTPGVRPRAL